MVVNVQITSDIVLNELWEVNLPAEKLDHTTIVSGLSLTTLHIPYILNICVHGSSPFSCRR